MDYSLGIRAGMKASEISVPHKPETSIKDSWKHKILLFFRLTNQWQIRIYRGFGNDSLLTVQGHVLKLGPLPRKKYRKNAVVNLLAVLRLFVVRPVAHVTVRLKGTEITTQTDTDGFFRLEWVPTIPLTEGWHEVLVESITPGLPIVEGRGRILIPAPTRYGCISDIDDTFLISHSSTIRKQLKVLLTQNAHSRKPFDDVVAHYQLLASACTEPGKQNPFFYVSSSEWNLYDYILEFSEKNELPEGIYLLSQLKRLHELWKTGQNKHFTKMERIARILQTYPERQFILFGDDSQEDPAIYTLVVKHHRAQIRSIYIRQVNHRNLARTKAYINEIEAMGVPCCYFTHSAKAIMHSKEQGLV